MSTPSLLISPSPVALTTTEAFAYCRELAQTHYENFPVGSWLVPKAVRPHVYSIYAFARTADDFADEGDQNEISPATRLARLADWARQLEQAYAGTATHPVFIALAETVRELQLPKQLFLDLLSAFSQDVTKTRYQTFAEVQDYCQRSANPVGRLILLLFGYRDEKLMRLSDDICTGLQLANFWQDVSVDLKKNRIYLPQEELERFQVTESALFAHEFDERFAALMKYQVARTRELLVAGQSLPSRVRGRLRYELRLTWQGGWRILEMIEQQKYDTLSHRPKITTWDKIALLVKTLLP